METCLFLSDKGPMNTAEILNWLKQTEADKYEYIGLRLQRDAETRTKVGSTLRPSSHWIDGRKTRRKLAGTAAFILRNKLVANMTEADIAPVVGFMNCRGYVPLIPGDRIVLVGSECLDTEPGSEMPEDYAASFKDAKLLSVFS